MLTVIILNAPMLSVIIQNVILLSVIKLSVIILRVIMLSGIMKCHNYKYHAECRVALFTVLISKLVCLLLWALPP